MMSILAAIMHQIHYMNKQAIWNKGSYMIILMLITFAAESYCEKKQKSEFQIKVEATYKQVLPCLRLTGTLNGQYPLRYASDLEAHYYEMLNVTAQYRGLPPHSGSGSYQGPWIENLFIKHFIDKPFSSFNGMIPIFVQWSDYHLNYRAGITSKSVREKTEIELYKPIVDKFRKNVLYVVISQANYGIDFLSLNYPNVLIFSAGGEGDIPIPLIKGDLGFMAVDHSVFPKYDVGFFGSIDHGHRKKLLDHLKSQLKNTKYTCKLGPSKTWIIDMSLTMFNLAPIGMGRASFRLGEIIQLGRIPVYLYEDFPWSPYEGSGLGPADIGYVIRGNNMRELIKVIKSATNESTTYKLNKVKQARYLYTYDGILGEIEKWFSDPFGPQGGYLRCKNDDKKTKMSVGMSLHI